MWCFALSIYRKGEELLNNGATPEEIFETSFRYRKYEKMIKADYLARRIKETPLVKDMWNEYHWGRSGSGKIYIYIKLREKYPDEVYLCNDYANSGASGGGFDFYSSNPANYPFTSHRMRYTRVDAAIAKAKCPE